MPRAAQAGRIGVLGGGVEPSGRESVGVRPDGLKFPAAVSGALGWLEMYITARSVEGRQLAVPQ